MEPLAFEMGVKRNGNVTSVGAPCPCDVLVWDSCVPGAEGVWSSVRQEHKGRMESIHWELREKEHQGLGMQEGWKHNALGVQEGGEHRTLGLQGGWDAGNTRTEAGTDVGAQQPGNVLSMTGASCCCWPWALAMASECPAG